MDRTPITIVTGLSGSGKSTAIDAFEDAGFYCVDNMPVALLPKFLELPFNQRFEYEGFAFGMDLREKDFITRYPEVFQALEDHGYRLDVIFLEADEDVLMRRFNQTRRHHPLAPGKRIVEGIRAEINTLGPIRDRADRIIDTSRINVHELKAAILKYCGERTRQPGIYIQVMSFGFKNGIPQDADLIIDVRFLANPYFEPALKPLDGETEPVKTFILEHPDTGPFLKKTLDLLDYLIPLYEKEGKVYLTVAFGCTGGRHRSVTIARAVSDHIIGTGKMVEIIHRDKGE